MEFRVGQIDGDSIHELPVEGTTITFAYDKNDYIGIEAGSGRITIYGTEKLSSLATRLDDELAKVDAKLEILWTETNPADITDLLERIEAKEIAVDKTTGLFDGILVDDMRSTFEQVFGVDVFIDE